MKIVICVDRLTGGGAQRVAALWVTGFVNEGHDVSVVLSNIRTPITYSIPSQVQIYNIDFNIRNGYVRHFFKMLFRKRKLKGILKKIEPDLVIGVGINWGTLIYRAKGNMTFKIISTDHFSYERPPQVKQISEKSQKIRFDFNQKLDAVTVLTQADKEFIGNRLRNVYVLPNPLAFEPNNNLEVKKDKTILAVGRLNDPIYKGFDILIEAFSMIAKECPDWKLQIMGEGNKEESDYLYCLSRNKGIEKIFEIIPFQADPLPFYRKTGIFCLSSRYEGFGMVLIEAMSQGCACVACDFKGRQREIVINDDYGLVCEANDINALAISLKKMILDEEYRHYVERNAPIRSQFYSLNNTMKRWNAIFEDAKII